MSARAINTLVRHAARVAGLTVSRIPGGYEVIDLHGTFLVDPMSAAEVIELSAEAATTGSPIFF